MELASFINFFFFKLYNIVLVFTKYRNESATGIHVFPILNPPPSSLPIPSHWVVPAHQPQASSIVHWTWTGYSFHIWYYTYFNAILPNHPTLSLSHRVQKTVLKSPVIQKIIIILIIVNYWCIIATGWQQLQQHPVLLFMSLIFSHRETKFCEGLDSVIFDLNTTVSLVPSLVPGK